MNATKLTDEISTFLVKLRDSGKTNMYGAGIYLENEFGFTKREAQDVLMLWMRTYKG